MTLLLSTIRDIVTKLLAGKTSPEAVTTLQD